MRPIDADKLVEMIENLQIRIIGSKLRVTGVSASNGPLGIKGFSKTFYGAEYEIPIFNTEEELNAFLLGSNMRRIVLLDAINNALIDYDYERKRK
jgi:hypothetical protein|nr:MAG TPA: hypothetical protein [Caudoviricetes sp.]